MLVAATPLVGAIAFPVAVPLVIRSMGLPSAVLTAVVLGSLWFVVMLFSAEMPSHD
ncbi:hypothetical protein [Cyanobium sp. CH-040]|uniref:hypothetical protein n=1 Tax=Cyanobium sp. CH-040 TaxID=2823708 RepID=UPI0020CC6507|nr:hypothetical protein [Cyanobium sp. CH-040]